MEIIETIENFAQINIFPNNIEDDEFIFYHGTNSKYSDEIEKYGLFPNHKPLTNFFSSIYNIADHLYAFTYDNDENFIEFNKIYKSTRGYFNDFTRISLTAISICAADYSIGNTAGGQGIRNIVNLKEAIINLDYSKLNNCYCDISDNQKELLIELDTKINELKENDGVVYAIKLQNSDISALDYANHSFHAVLLSTKHIEPDRIIAKMIIPKNTKIPDNLIKNGNNKTLELLRAYPPSFIGRIIQKNIKRNDIINVVKELKETI